MPTEPEIAARIEALLAQMTVDQKLGQMLQPERMSITPDEVRDHHIGSVLSGGGSCPGDNLASDWIAMNDAYWAASMAEGEGRVPIPLIYGVDAVHGHANLLGATVFPHNIGLGAARDPELMTRIARATAREVLATGVEWTFAPTIAIAQDLRWGRTYESFSEDPALVTAFSAAFVRGLQEGPDAIVACAKHFVGDGATTLGNDQGNARMTEAELAVHLAPYQAAIDAGVLTVMASLSSWNGSKLHGHRYLLTDVLKDRMGFDGFVVSDWDGADYLADDYRDALAIGTNAGIDMFMIATAWREALAHLKRLVAEGWIPMARIDDAVRRILRVKLRYGLFESPRPAERPWAQQSGVLGADAHRAVAREAVRKSLVLLKNDGVLPVRADARILVAGKAADSRGHLCGGFTVAWQGVTDNAKIVGGTSIWEGIQAQAPNATLSPDGSAADPAAHDVAIVVIGERPYAEGFGDIRPDAPPRGSSPEGRIAKTSPYGQSLELATLHPEDLATLRAIADLGIPVVAVLVSGRPLAITAELAASNAFVAAWLPGSEGGGVADVLLGRYAFQGTLPFAWPSAPDGDAAGRRVDPVFPVGFGLR